jgi:hypothetical protein
MLDSRAAVQKKCTVWTLVSVNKLFLYDVQDKKHVNKDIVQKMLEVSGRRWHVNIIIITGFEVRSALDEDPVLVGCKCHCGW